MGDSTFKVQVYINETSNQNFPKVLRSITVQVDVQFRGHWYSNKFVLTSTVRIKGLPHCVHHAKAPVYSVFTGPS